MVAKTGETAQLGAASGADHIMKRLESSDRQPWLKWLGGSPKMAVRILPGSPLISLNHLLLHLYRVHRQCA